MLTVDSKVNRTPRVSPDRRERGTLEERMARGREAAAACPVKTLAGCTPAARRADVIALLTEQSASRVAELIPIRYGRMSASPFAFFRGSAIIQAHDLARRPVTGIEVQAVGDAHIANFGMFLSPTRHLVFDINDFDECAPGPWEWDVCRLAASVELCGRERGFSQHDRRAAVRACAKVYVRTMAEFAAMGELDVWHAHLDLDEVVSRFEDEMSGKESRTLRRAMKKARAKDSGRAVEKLARVEDGHLRFEMRPPELVPLSEHHGYRDTVELSHALIELMRRYFDSLPYDRRFLLNRYRYQDAAQKVVGVGSVGTRAWAVLLAGKDANDPLVMQVKEAQQSVVERYWRPSSFDHAGERVVQGQRLIQSTSDILLGWTSVSNPLGERRDYYVRQLWNGKGSIDLAEIGEEGLRSTARLCAWSLAHAHARTGDGIAIAAYLGYGLPKKDAHDAADAFADALADYASAYAVQNELDYQLFCEMIATGELPCVREDS